MEFNLIRSKRKTLSMELVDGEILVRAPLRASKREIVRFVESHSDWIKKQKQKEAQRKQERASVKKLTQEELEDLMKEARAYFPAAVARYAALMGEEYGSVTVRCQKTRWGSCSTKRNLNFNCLLMLTPTAVRESVVVHELCHLKEMNHSERFYERVYRFCPDYDRQNRWLKEHGPMLLYRLPEKNR